MSPVGGQDGLVAAAIVTALASACGFALSTSLQHRVAGAAPASVRGPIRLLRHLLRRPVWVLGILTGAVSLTLHGIALRFGAIALVQPIMVAGVVLAVPVRAALDRRRPSRAELTAVSIAASGLAVFLVVADPEPVAAPRAGGVPLAFTICGLALAAIVVAAAYQVMAVRARAFALGAAAGVLFGLTAGLLKLLGEQLQSDGLWAAVTDWPAWALVFAGGCGLAVNQYAYRIAPLSVSMPMVNVVDVIVAILFGWIAFAEVPAHGAASLLTQGVALCWTACGLRQVAFAWERREPAARSSHPSSDPSTQRSHP